MLILASLLIEIFFTLYHKSLEISRYQIMKRSTINRPKFQTQFLVPYIFPKFIKLVYLYETIQLNYNATYLLICFLSNFVMERIELQRPREFLIDGLIYWNQITIYYVPVYGNGLCMYLKSFTSSFSGVDNIQKHNIWWTIFRTFSSKFNIQR